MLAILFSPFAVGQNKILTVLEGYSSVIIYAKT
jgi:hypothetical protein